jgi:hypothetical protein
MRIRIISGSEDPISGLGRLLEDAERSKAMSHLLVVHARKPDCLFNLRDGLWGKTFRKSAKHSCVKLFAKDLDHPGPCAFGGLNDHPIFKDAIQSGLFGNPAQQAIIVLG